MPYGEAMSGPADAALADRIRSVLAEVPDPEIPVLSVLDLGIVRDIDTAVPAVSLTPTYTGCPATLAIETAVRTALDSAGLPEVKIVRRLVPAWTTDWISPSGREKLRAYGIAPPEGPTSPACPRCGSKNTSEVSRFGSTPCKSLWRCLSCQEPFDHFKCH